MGKCRFVQKVRSERSPKFTRVYTATCVAGERCVFLEFVDRRTSRGFMRHVDKGVLTPMVVKKRLCNSEQLMQLHTAQMYPVTLKQDSTVLSNHVPGGLS